MQSGCFPDKQNPVTFPELVAQNWTLDDAAGPDIKFPGRPEPPLLSGSVAKIMPWTKGDDYYRFSLKHRIHNQYSTTNGLINALILIRRANERLHWSDVTFAVWEALSASQGANIQDLRWIVLTEVDNFINTLIIDKAVPDVTKVATFEPGTEAHRAIMGSPNWGIGSVYLLMEHKKQLGHKSIGRIIVCCEELEEEEVEGPSVILEILDVPAPQKSGENCASALVANA
ncbi:MAG: hypothetical protein Q9186_007146 [Xanthomendoza sp. 1 TL-2023]